MNRALFFSDHAQVGDDFRNFARGLSKMGWMIDTRGRAGRQILDGAVDCVFQDEDVDLRIHDFDLVCVNLCPLEKINPRGASGCSLKDVALSVELGLAVLIEAIAKSRITVCRLTDFEKTLDWLRGGELDETEFLTMLAASTVRLASDYLSHHGDDFRALAMSGH